MFALDTRFGFVQRMVAFLSIPNAKIESALLTQYMVGIWYTHLFARVIPDTAGINTAIIEGNTQLGFTCVEDSNHVILTIYKYFIWADIIAIGKFYYIGLPPVFFHEAAAKELKLSPRAKIPRNGHMISIEDAIRHDVKGMVERLSTVTSFKEAENSWYVDDKMIHSPDAWMNNRIKISKKTFHELFNVRF